MTRTITKVGDVFSVLIDTNTKKYFQYVGNDLMQLNSDVIKTFKNSAFNMGIGATFFKSAEGCFKLSFE